MGRTVRGNGVPGGLAAIITDSSEEEPELKWLTRGPNSVAAWEKFTGGLSVTAFSSSFSETLIRSSLAAAAAIAWRTCFSREA